MKIPDDKEKRTTIRMPIELHGQLVAVAKYKGLSFNAEVIARLEAAAVSDQFERLFRENAEIKQLLRELIEKN